MQIKKILLSFTLSTFLFTSGTQADNIGSFFDSQIATSYTGAGGFKGQTRGVYTMGGFKSRYQDLGAFSPIHIQLPSLKMGCGGIDAIFGAFSFLDAEYVVDKGKAIISAAPAFAFQLALSTLDKDTQTIVAELEKITQQMNNFNIDSCKASQKIVSASMNFFEDGVNEKVNSGQAEFAPKARTESSASILSGWISSAQGFLGNDPVQAKKELEKKVMVGSLLKESINMPDATGLDMAIFGVDTSTGESVLEGFLRYLVGDLIGFKIGEANNFTYETSYIPAGENASVETFIKGGNVKITSAKLQADNLGKPTTAEGKYYTKGVIEVFKTKIVEILASMRSNQVISANNRTFIQSLPIPIYRFLNAQALSGGVDDELLAEYLALVETKAMLDWVLTGSINGMRMIVKDDPSSVNKQRAEIILNAREAKKAVNREFDTLMKQFEAKRELMLYYKSLEVAMANETLF